jgi:hypothetical protein
MSLRTLFVLPLGLSLIALVAGCSSDTVVNNGGSNSGGDRTRDDAGTDAAGATDTTSGSGSGATDTGTPSLDVETDAPADTTSDTAADTAPDTTPPVPVDCTAIPIAATSGESCVQADPTCAPGAACIGLGTGLGAECLQICTPGQCSDICGAAGACAALADQNNNPLLRDLDGDGIEDEVGACFIGVPTFGRCGAATGACADGEVCVGTEPDANCTPTCATQGESCGMFGGVEAVCNLQLTLADGTTENACSIDCTTAADCPTGLSCVAIPGGSICLER